jgi:hypothetical protein
MEVFDFEHSPQNHIELHAGWARSAFIDVLEEDTRAQPVAIITPPESLHKREVYEYASKLLVDCCQIVDLTRAACKDDFIADCKKHAGLLL